MLERVWVADHGIGVVRVKRTLERLGIAMVGASEEVLAGADAEAIAAQAAASRADVVHPGYGPWAQSAALARALAHRGIGFAGARARDIEAFAAGGFARPLAHKAGLALLAKSRPLHDRASAFAVAVAIGYPVALRSESADWERRCEDPAALRAAWEEWTQSGFAGAPALCVERCLPCARYLDVPLVGDGRGKVWALGVQDASLRCGGRALLEEAPAAGLDAEQGEHLVDMAVRLARAVHYRSVGRARFVYDGRERKAYFLGMDTGLKAGHELAAAITGIDLVEWMLRLAAGENGAFDGLGAAPACHAILAHVRAEAEASGGERPLGPVTTVAWPSEAHVTAAIEPGSELPEGRSSTLAHIVVSGKDRAGAWQALDQALMHTVVRGVATNRDTLRAWVQDPRVREGRMDVDTLASGAPAVPAVEVLKGGAQTTLQDWPGRLGYWRVGVPPSGPMDALAHRYANGLVGNDPAAAALEMTLAGPQLKFHAPALIALTGAPFSARLDGQVLPMWQVCRVEAGSVLLCGVARGAGARAYLAIQGGLAADRYLGSTATFSLGGFGGHEGRALKAGDRLAITAIGDETVIGRQLSRRLRPRYERHWTLGVLYGPHGADDFFTTDDIEAFFAADWRVHAQSNRTGVRLIGPRPRWARPDGGEAGLHPSNIHDNAYAIGAVDYTGDMPVILGPDGPSLGGFVCPAVVVSAELWKLGQLRPGDTVRFQRLSLAEAREAQARQEDALRLRPPPFGAVRPASADASDAREAVIARFEGPRVPVAVVYRRAGDANVLVEYGPPILDIGLRLRVHALMEWLESHGRERLGAALIDLTPGIRSLQVHYDPDRLSQAALVAILAEADAALGDLQDARVASRVVHLPLAWDDSQTRLATARYEQLVRKDAPWCPRNIEFIRRINGLDSEEAVREIVFAADYLVLGLGDVYLGAPVATPVDPRHRLVTTKYNPARTWTPENAVGIGGAYLCIYGMEGPGGYQFVGRTLQMWNRGPATAPFVNGDPWLLRFFDRIRFFPVSEEELLAMRADFARGRLAVRIEEGYFSWPEYQRFLETERPGIEAFKARQQAAFVRERQSWALGGDVAAGRA